MLNLAAAFAAAATRLATAGAGLGLAAATAGELALAAGGVVVRRTALSAAALGDPLGADAAEFARMGPEKIDAFSQAVFAVWSEVWGMQRQLLGYAAAETGSIARAAVDASLSPHPIRLAQVQAAWMAGVAERAAEHVADMAERSLGVGGAALDPIHRRATANARRLARRDRC